MYIDDSIFLSRGASHPLSVIARLTSDIKLMLRRPDRLQFAALCYRWTKKRKDVEILLITSRDTGRWVIPKGWPMENRQAHAVAEREAFEEAGVQGRAEKDPSGYYYYLKRLDNGLKVPCRVQVHALEIDGFAKDFKEKGVRQLEFVSCEEAANRVDEQDLKELILSFHTRMQSKSAKQAARS
jgi:8-oxo-dGTP pyrophosphatase MutT (NUDIX family)